jgi:flagellar biogenesis protein FliO
VGINWPGDELSLLGVIAFIGAFSFLLVRALRRRLAPAPMEAAA